MLEDVQSAMIFTDQKSSHIRHVDDNFKSHIMHEPCSEYSTFNCPVAYFREMASAAQMPKQC
jgi:hypothetical protein